MTSSVSLAVMFSGEISTTGPSSGEKKKTLGLMVVGNERH